MVTTSGGSAVDVVETATVDAGTSSGLRSVVLTSAIATEVVVLAGTGAAVVEVEADVVAGGAVTTSGLSGALQAASVNTRTIGAVAHMRMRRQYRLRGCTAAA